jgi:class 3 adenylate cyclase
VDRLLLEAKSFFNNGEFFRAFDIAAAGFERFPDDRRLAHRAVLSLANCGATPLALENFRRFGLDRSAHLDDRSLLGRLTKDLAFAETGPMRRRLLAQARGIYEAAYRQSAAGEAYYPGINAATLALLSGDETGAAALATAVLDLLGPRLDEPHAPDRYWILASAIEAHLVLGEGDAARALIPPAIAAGGTNAAELATTARQLARILDARGEDAAVLAAFAPPLILHFHGHIIAPEGRPGRFPATEEASVAQVIGRTLDGMRVGAGYGSLAAGADILFAEALLDRDVALNLVLPFAMADFVEQSVRPAGETWIARFERCMAAAKTLRYATEDAYLGDDHLFTYCSALAMGLAVVRARHMGASVHQIALWDGEPRSGVAGTVIDLLAWRRLGLPQTILRCGARVEADDLAGFTPPAADHGRRDMRAMLFADLHGFSKLGDTELPLFTAHVMGAVAAAMAPFRGGIEILNTWGDGIFAVFTDVAQAADCALALQARVSGLDLAAIGLPPTLSLRVGGHYGPVYRLEDPVTGRPNLYGRHVSRAARIEPVTPEGCVYVTETFAAVLALEAGARFACDYVGVTELAKSYGPLRMFLLRRDRDGAGPSVLGDIERVPVTAASP